MTSWKAPLTAVAATAALLAAALPAAASTGTGTAPDGTAMTVAIDDFDGPAPSSREERVVVTDDGRIVPTTTAARPDAAARPSVRRLLAGTGLRAASTLAPSSAATVARSLAPVTEELYVAAIQDSSTTGSLSTTQATQIASTAAGYWQREAKGGIASFTVAAAVDLPLDGSCSRDYEDLWALAAVEYPGVDFTAPGTHLAVFSPLGCEASYDYAGIANVGDDLTTGGYIQVVGDEWGILAHELGHHFGLGHADLALQTATDVATYEYFGLFGPQALQVSDYEPGALDGAWRAQLGLPGEAARERVARWNSAPALYSLTPLTSSGVSTLVVQGSDGAPAFYLDYRSGAAGDTHTFYAADATGLVSAAWFDDLADVSYRRGVTVSLPALGDLFTAAFPANDGTYHAAGRPGDALTLMSGAVTIRVVSQSSTGAQVLVSYRANPQVGTTTKVAVPAVAEHARAKVAISVTAPNGAAVSGQVDVLMDGKRIGAATVAGGRAAFTTPSGMAAGRHSFTARYLGTPAFRASAASTSVLIKDASTVRASAAKVRAGTGATVVAKVRSDLKATGTVRVYKGSVVVGKASVKAGKATIHLPRSWKAKTYKLTVKYSGSSTVAGSSTTTKVVVLPRR
ncbi:Ig-like domain-containing protein [Cellulomonas alba]|uniref:Ig-like domain-containing protein n=1 Tax=Cellulomonas alba TaxID=3053467 RepID=A0ABT7SII0_9CELL|nr:Ig-like domain-containing protein [Cellulomonas alba]MDM7855988.1 Ig-like domain-containing protein [Cellulomonas alba]